MKNLMTAIFFKAPDILYPMKRNGFSLIELMVVVAIIGILATIAIPQYQKFQGRVRQTEAKSKLANLFAAEAGFFAEKSSYTECVSGIAPPANDLEARYYSYGFIMTSTVCGGGTVSCVAMDWDATSIIEDCPTYAGLWTQSIPATRKVHAMVWTDLIISSVPGGWTWGHPDGGTPGMQTGSNKYVAAAAGLISSHGAGAAAYDVWLINQNRVLVNGNSGL